MSAANVFFCAGSDLLEYCRNLHILPNQRLLPTGFAVALCSQLFQEGARLYNGFNSLMSAANVFFCAGSDLLEYCRNLNILPNQRLLPTGFAVALCSQLLFATSCTLMRLAIFLRLP